MRPNPFEAIVNCFQHVCQDRTSSTTMTSTSQTTNALQSSNQPPNLTVLTRQVALQQQQKQQQISNLYVAGPSSSTSSTPVDTSDLMIRLRESIKQKEEFLKSPLPVIHNGNGNGDGNGQQQPQHFFPHTPPAGSPQLSATNANYSACFNNVADVSTGPPSAVAVAATTVGSVVSTRGIVGGQQLRGQHILKQPISNARTSGSAGDILPNVSSCDMHNYYAKNVCDAQYERNSGTGGGGSGTSGSNRIVGVHLSSSALNYAHPQPQPQQQQQQQLQHHQQRQNVSNAGTVAANMTNSHLVGAGKYAKDLDYFESLQETGVTNKVFERKLVSHMAKGFDPFKPLSINTNAIDAAGPSGVVGGVASNAGNGGTVHGNVMLVKKPGVLYDSLQHHPLHQLQLQQLQHTQYQPPKLQHSHVVDGQVCSTGRMEIHKATLATTINEHTPNKYNSTSYPELETKLASTTLSAAALADISESSDLGSLKPAVTAPLDTSNVVRRFKSISTSFDEGKPMRRTSYLRATNNDADYHSETSSTTTTATATTTLGNSTEESSLSSTSATSATVSASTNSGTITGIITIEKGKEFDDHPNPTYDIIGVGHEFIETPNGLEDIRLTTLSIASGGSRRASVNSDMRSSLHIDAELNNKIDTKNINKMEIFETEMEIKSPCINGKRISEYRSWRQVKIEIKGDILKIYPSRHTKSDNNVIELDIRNFKFFDESLDKKKYIFRMQSKPTNLATLGNELNLDDAHDKLTSSGSSASGASSTQHAEQAQHTEILFKTKSGTEMKRIFGLLQWKNSLIYDDQDNQGKQLAEPQKTAATTYCDESQPLQAEYSPLSSASGGALECSAGANIANNDSISPIMKTRKSSSHKNIPDKDLGSPKAKNWKDLLFRRGGSSGNHNADISPSNLAAIAKTTGSIGVPLRNCPMSKNNEYVPHIVDVCTNIVETKGLGVVGIYRIPGNKAAISELSEQVNKNDFSWDRCNTDVRWEDVNVVSSLLKLFIRSLPDAMMPSSFYNHFIEADKKPSLLRLKVLKELLESLPRYSYETMKHIIRHLNRVSKNCDVNRMEPKNLAIIFGPSIIRTSNDTLETAVKDMKHQCRIVELLVSQYDYFFENGSTPDLSEITTTSAGLAEASGVMGINAAVAQSQEDQTSMLLHNVSKIERFTERETRTSRFIPQLRRRTHSKRGTVSSDTYSGESVLSLDYTKVSSSSASSSSTMQSSVSSSGKKTTATNVTSKTSNNNNSSNSNNTTTKKKDRGFLSSRTHHRKASLDEKDSGSGSGSAGSIGKEQQRSSVDISILLTDDESSNSRISDAGSMSLTTITDALDSKLRNLRSGSESNDENDSPEYPKNRRHTLGQPLHLHSENIPYADESPERLFHNFCPLDVPHSLMLSRSCTATNTIASSKCAGLNLEKEKAAVATAAAAVTSSTSVGNSKAHKLQHSATLPISSNLGSLPSAATTPTAVVTVKTTTTTPTSLPVGASSATLCGGGSGGGNSSARNSYSSKNFRFSTSVYDRCCSEDDSEGSTTSDPKEALVITSPSFFLERYNKKRRDHRLFRSASFNCRNYSSRHSSAAIAVANSSNPTLTKDEKTDMNLTKKRQIQNKQNRSIKRRHTVGGPHDYAANTNGDNSNHHTRTVNGAGKNTTTTTTTTTVLRRIPIPSGNGNISLSGNNNNSPQSDGNNSNGGGGTGSAGAGGNGVGGAAVNSAANGAATVAVATGVGNDHVLEVGIRIKNINRNRY